MKIYLVGGFVRDTLLELQPKDKDYVVVGSSPEEMLSKGFVEVGKDFPVFLHPETKDEYALARTERKVGLGYKGFDCDWKGVSLDDDLFRRDLTINSIAKDIETGAVIDPFNGLSDLENKVLRPVSEYFKEDPIRLLRVARFLARYGEGWIVCQSIVQMGMEMEHLGELDNLVPERVWMETEKALKEPYPHLYFEFLLQFNFPFMETFQYMKTTTENNPYHQESDVFVHTMMVLKHASKNLNDPEVNFSVLLHDIAKPICYAERGNAHGHDKEGVSLVESFCKQWKVPNNYRDLAKIVCEQHQRIHTVMGRGQNNWSRPKSIMKVFEETSALYKPERFKKLLKACESDSKGRIGLSANDDYIQRRYLEECLDNVLSLDTKEISQTMLTNSKSGIIIGQKIREERIRKIREVQNKWKEKLSE